IVTSVLLNCHALLQEPLPTTRQWSPLSQREPSDQVFILLAQAREAVCSQKLDQGVALFRQCMQLAGTIPHPTGLINALNDLAWYIRGAQPELASAKSQEAMYQAGRFFEDSHRWFFVFDTAAQIEEEQRQPCFLETACLIRDLAAELPSNQRDRYAQRIAACTLWDFDRSKSRYRCTQELRIALKRRIPSLGMAARASGLEKARLSNLLSGKVAEVKGDTLRKLIHGLAIQPDCRNDPTPLIAEWVKSETRRKAERFLTRLVAFHPRRRTRELLVLYMGTPARNSRLPGLSRGSRLATFLNRCQQLSPPRSTEEEFLLALGEMAPPLVRARIDLAGEFLKRLGGRNRDRFTQFYLTAHEQDRRILDSFVRNYARYSIHWGMQIPLEDGLLSFVRHFNLNASIAAVAFWAFEKKADRLRMTKIASGDFPIPSGGA
ncbi:MAG: hypothetical protein WCN99_03155, partial [bacterium]